MFDYYIGELDINTRKILDRHIRSLCIHPDQYEDVRALLDINRLDTSYFDSVVNQSRYEATRIDRGLALFPPLKSGPTLLLYIRAHGCDQTVYLPGPFFLPNH